MPTITQATQEPWPPSGWLTKKTAAERLGLSESRIAAMADRKIKATKSHNPESRQLVTLFHAGDVERVAFERQNPEATKVPTNAVAKPDNLPLVFGYHERGVIDSRHNTEHYSIREWVKPSGDSPFFKFYIEGPGAYGKLYIALNESCGPDLIRGLELAYQAGAATNVGGSPAQWLTVKEAADRSGLPESIVTKLIASGDLPAVDCGPRPGGRYRVTRKALDSFEGHR